MSAATSATAASGAGDWTGGISLRAFVLSFIAVAAVCLVSILWIDRPLTEWVLSWHYQYRRLSGDISQLGSGLWPIGGSLLLFVLFRFGLHRRAAAARALFVLTAVIAGTAVTNLLKVIFGRSRPHILRQDDIYAFDFFRLPAEWRAFPSGHAETIMTTAVCLAIIFPRVRLPFLAVAGVVGLARVGSFSHYLSDVVSGAYVGVVVALTVAYLFTWKGVELPVK